jgi:L-ribulose-5-phosphate 4-epimerase
MNIYRNLKQKAFECNMELPKKGLVFYTFGNVSCFDKESGVFAIKPSGIPYADLKPDDMGVIDLENNVVDGDFKPSSDTKTHVVLYRHFSKIGGIVHTHSTYAVAWAQAMMSIPILGTTHADHLTADIPCTNVMSDQAIEGDYETETGKLIVETFKDISYNSAVLEELAKMAYLTKHINSDVHRLKDTLILKHYNRKHGVDAYYGQNQM